MASLRSGLLRLAADARIAFRAAPIEATLALLAAATFSAVVARDAWSATVGRLFVTFGLAVPATFAVTLLHAQTVLRAGARWALSFAAVALAASYAFGAYDPGYTAADWRLALLLVAAALLPFAATTIGGDRERSWWVHARLLLRVVATAAYGAALYAGISIAIVAIERLFELRIDDTVYAHLAGWIFFALVPWIVVGGTEPLVQPTTPHADDIRRFARLAATFLAAPLVVGYTAILYAYAIRVAVTGEVPKNLLSPLVAVAGALWLLIVFLTEGAASTGLTRLARWLPPALLPMLGLGIWAVFVRIEQYGWTEFRFVRVAAFAALAFLAAAGTARPLIRRGNYALDGAGDVGDAGQGAGDFAGDATTPPRSLAPLPWTAVPVVLVLAAFLSAVGPWSAAAVARRSQQARLADAIDRARESAGVPAGTVPGPTTPRPVPAELYQTINETAAFLAGHFGPDAVREIVGYAPADDYHARFTVADSLGFSRGPATRPGGGALLVMAWRPDTAAVHGIVGGSLYPVEVSLEEPMGMPRPSPQRPVCPNVVAVVDPEDESALAPVTKERGGIPVTLDPRSARVVVHAPPDGRRLTADLRPLADSVAARAARDCAAPPALAPAEALLTLRDDAGNPRGQLLVNGITLTIPADPAPAGVTSPAPVIRRVSGQIILPATR